MDLVFQIRQATLDDLATIAEISAATFHEAFDGTSKQVNIDGYIASAFNLQQLKREMSQPKTIFFVAQSGQVTLGYAKLSESEAPECVTDPCAVELSRLYVRQKYLAQKVGSALLQRVLDEGRRQGYRTIFLGVWEHNERAKKFYAKWGFKRIGEHVFQMGDDPQIDWWMERRI